MKPKHPNPRALLVNVYAFSVATDEQIKREQRNLATREDCVWLAKFSIWALTNGAYVEVVHRDHDPN
jgi:hypothetical protein